MHSRHACNLVVTLIGAVGLAGQPVLPAAPASVRVLILTGASDPSHNWQQTSAMLERILGAARRFTVRRLEEPRGITAATLEGYDAVIVNYNGPRWGSETEAALEAFVASGKGLVSFHGVSYGPFLGTEQRGSGWSYDPQAAWPAWRRLLGAFWPPQNIGHSIPHAFRVRLVDRDHPVTRGMPPEFTFSDELYHRLELEPGVRVLGVAFSDQAWRGTGRDEPVFWAGSFGKGRTFHTTLGHDEAAMYQPGFATLMARAVEWAATGTVTLEGWLDLARTAADPVRVLVVTGGHAYPSAFYSLFEGYDDLVWAHAATEQEAFRPNLKDRWDVLVFHDMREDLGLEARASLRAFVEAGKGVVSIHHAIVDFTSWPWWYEEVIGGKYFTMPQAGRPASTFKEGVDLVVRPVAEMRSHPVLRGVFPLVVNDEAYKGMWHSPRIQVLMETDHPLNDRPVVYIGPGGGGRAIYIQLGHSEGTLRHPGYRRLVRNAILWAAGRLPDRRQPR
jgi:type 1 glutamine amidotransferase